MKRFAVFGYRQQDMLYGGEGGHHYPSNRFVRPDSGAAVLYRRPRLQSDIEYRNARTETLPDE
jgi:hypothetical protein